MTRQSLLSVVALVFITLTAICPSAAFAASGPEESVAMLQKAIDTRDMQLAATYLDIETATGNALDTLLKDKAVLQQLQQFPAAAVILAFGGAEGGGAAIRELLTGEAKEYIRHGVVSGAFAGKPVEGASVYRGMFGKAFRGGEKDKRTFGPAAVKSKKGDEAVVTTTLMGRKKKHEYPLELVVKKQEGAWRVVGVKNIAELAALDRQTEKK